MKAAIWQGFDHFWENDPHRVNLFASCISAGPDANVTYQSGMSIGRFPPDICHAVTTVHQAGTPTTGFIDGEVTLDVSGTVGEGVERQASRSHTCCPAPASVRQCSCAGSAWRRSTSRTASTRAVLAFSSTASASRKRQAARALALYRRSSCSPTAARTPAPTLTG